MSFARYSNPLRSVALRPIGLALGLMLCLPAQAAGDPALEVDPKVQSWADRCTDFTTNGWAFKAPANFLPWFAVASEPDLWLEYARRGLDPQYYVRSINSALDPAMVKNYLEWTDPIILEKWSVALADPQYLSTVGGMIFDGEKMLRWAKVPFEPKAWNLLVLASSPDTWMKWVNAPNHLATQALMAKMLDPNTPLRMLQALGDPANYPGMDMEPLPAPSLAPKQAY